MKIVTVVCFVLALVVGSANACPNVIRSAQMQSYGTCNNANPNVQAPLAADPGCYNPAPNVQAPLVQAPLVQAPLVQAPLYSAPLVGSAFAGSYYSRSNFVHRDGYNVGLGFNRNVGFGGGFSGVNVVVGRGVNVAVGAGQVGGPRRQVIRTRTVTRGH